MGSGCAITETLYLFVPRTVSSVLRPATQNSQTAEQRSSELVATVARLKATVAERQAARDEAVMNGDVVRERVRKLILEN